MSNNILSESWKSFTDLIFSTRLSNAKRKLLAEIEKPEVTPEGLEEAYSVLRKSNLAVKK